MSSLSRAQLVALIDEVVVDCYNDEEQLTMLEEHLRIPFTTEVLGVEVTVRQIDLRPESIVAICDNGGRKQAIGLLDLPLPVPPPNGAQWIEAYRHWAAGR